MKKILFSLILLSGHGYTADLQCEKSYQIFRGIYNDYLSVRDGPNLNLSLLKKYEDTYEYSRLFSKNHPDQVYRYGNWISKAAYADQVLLEHAMIVGAHSKFFGYRLEKPKANFISSVGEVCVVPIESRSSYLGEDVTLHLDSIFVRNLNSNQWHVFEYLGSELKKDFDEFFPDFPKSIKLSERHSSLDPSFEASIKRTAEIYKALGMELTPEMIERRKAGRKRIDERRKANGFE